MSLEKCQAFEAYPLFLKSISTGNYDPNWAIHFRYYNLIPWLIKNGPFEPVVIPDLRIAKMFLESGKLNMDQLRTVSSGTLDPELLWFMLESPNWYFRTSLYRACSEGYLEILKSILGSYLGLDSSLGLLVACHNGHLEIVKFLISEFQPWEVLYRVVDIKERNVCPEPKGSARSHDRDYLLEALNVFSSLEILDKFLDGEAVVPEREFDKLDVVQFLLESGIPVSEKARLVASKLGLGDIFES